MREADFFWLVVAPLWLLGRWQGTHPALRAAVGVVLLLSGEPLDEPIVGRGPFVMNTEDEIRQAYADFRAGHFGAFTA